MIERFFIFSNGARSGERFVLDLNRTITIGRGSDNQIVLDERKVSRNHGRVTVTGSGEVFIEDLASTNGIYVNDQRLTDRTQLASGDKIQIGRQLMSFVMDDVKEIRPPQRERSAPFQTQKTEMEAHMATVTRPSFVAPKEKILLAGLLEEISLGDILQTLHSSNKTGRLILFDGQAEHGRIEMKDGQIVYAQAMRSLGVKALFRLLRLTAGRFKMIALELSELSTGAGQIDPGTPFQSLLLEGYRQVDEFKRLGVSARSQYELNRENSVALGELKPAMLPVIQAVIQTSLLAEILDMSPLADLETLKLLEELADKRLIRKIG